MMIQDETLAIATMETPSVAITPQQSVQMVQRVMKDVMQDNMHYGKIPGCGDKPTLLQPGAQVLALAFGFAPDYDWKITDMGNGHREYTVVCKLISRNTGMQVGSGIGSGSTMESKYRYRTGQVTFTGRPVPKEYWNDRDIKLIGGKGHSTKKNPDTGQWEIVEQGEKVENPDIADVYNTVLKMAKKRAYVDAVLTATAASDMFTQDLEDIAANRASSEPVVAPAASKDPSAPAGQDGKNPMLADFAKVAKEYSDLTGKGTNEIAKLVNGMLDVPLHRIGTQAEAEAALSVISGLLADAKTVVANEDIPF